MSVLLADVVPHVWVGEGIAGCRMQRAGWHCAGMCAVWCSAVALLTASSLVVLAVEWGVPAPCVVSSAPTLSHVVQSIRNSCVCGCILGGSGALAEEAGRALQPEPFPISKA